MTLSCTGLTLSVPGRILVDDFAVAFQEGQVWAVLGRNGTGKSTLIHALAGLAQPTRGRIDLDGVPLGSVQPRQRARALGILPQLEEGTFWGTVAEYVLLGRFPHTSAWYGFDDEDVRLANDALAALRMSEFAGQRYTTLSGGERQRVRIAQILAQSARIVLLDEPLQHLDLAHQAHVIDLVSSRVRTERHTAIMVLHEPLWIGAACTHAIIFSGNGQVEAGPAGALLTRERLERAYGCKLREIDHPRGRCFVPDV
jgi:iron complex transport system ATP-binding protein